MTTTTIQVLPNTTTATQIITAGDGDTLITNTDLVNTVYLGDNDSIRATDSQGIVPLPPNGSIVVNGQSNLFAVNSNPSPVTIAKLTGGLGNFLGITQGGGKLAIPAIQSPNFQLNPLKGWSIDQSGNAYFESVTIGGGVVRVTFSAVEPLNPNTGDVWFDLGNDARPGTFNGTQWVTYQWGQKSIGNNAIGTNQIANAAVTPAQIANLTASLIGQTGGILNANPYFWGADGTGWLVSAGVLTITGNPPAGAPYKYAATYTSGGGPSAKLYDFNELFPVQPNTQYLVIGWVNSPVTTVSFGMDWRNSAKTLLGETVQPITVPVNTWVPISAVVTSPSTAGLALGNIALFPAAPGGTMYATGLQALQQIPGNLIQAGTVDATRLVAGLVYAGIIDGTVVNAATFNGSVFNGTQFIANKDGVFLYNGVPAANNLYISIAPKLGTDPFGTGFPTGIKIFGSNGAQTILQNNGTSAVIQLLAAGMTHNTTQAEVAAEQVLPGAVNEAMALLLSSGTESNHSDAVLMLTSDSADATVPGTIKLLFGLVPVLTISKTEADITVPIVIDQWHPITLINGWVNNASFVPARYRKVASPPNSVQVQAFISGNAATGNTFFQLPAGYVPANAQGFAVGCTNSADSTDGRVDTLGNLSIANVVMPDAQTFFINDVISLD